MSLFTTLTLHLPAPCSLPPSAHNHLLVSIPFAAVRIKLYIIVAIMSLAPWLLLTTNQHSCFLLQLLGEIVCFENAQNQIA